MRYVLASWTPSLASLAAEPSRAVARPLALRPRLTTGLPLDSSSVLCASHRRPPPCPARDRRSFDRRCPQEDAEPFPIAWRRHSDISRACRSQPRCVAALDVQSRPAAGPRALPAKGSALAWPAWPRARGATPSRRRRSRTANWSLTSSMARSAGATLTRRAPQGHDVRTRRSPDRAPRDCAPGCRGPGDPLGRHRSPLG